MTIREGTKKIRALLDALPRQKNDKDILFVLFKIDLVVECMQGPIKKRSDRRQVAYDTKTRIIKKALKQLLTAFDKIFAKHVELGDSDVRDQMYAAIYRGFINPQPRYSLPATFGMLSEKGNAAVHRALHNFLAHPEVLAATKALKNPQDRFAAFQDNDVETSEDTSCFEYFGYSNKVRVP